MAVPLPRLAAPLAAAVTTEFDGVIDQDALGLDRVYIQAKRYALGNNVGSGAIRDFFGTLTAIRLARVSFVTTSIFSPSAIETAQYLSKESF